MTERERIGCTDGGCDLERPTGMHTNGGCHCLEGLEPENRRRVRAYIRRLRGDLTEAREHAENVFEILDNVLEGNVDPSLVEIEQALPWKKP